MEQNTTPKGSSDRPFNGVALARKALEDSLRLRKARLTERERNQVESPEVEAKAND